MSNLEELKSQQKALGLIKHIQQDKTGVELRVLTEILTKHQDEFEELIEIERAIHNIETQITARLKEAGGCELTEDTA